MRALSLCTCRRQYPGAAVGRNPRSSHPAVSAFPDSAVGSACTSTFSRLAQRSRALRPAHSRSHQIVTANRRLQPFRYLHDCSDCFRLERIAGWALHPLESAAFPRRTPISAIRGIATELPRFALLLTFAPEFNPNPLTRRPRPQREALGLSKNSFAGRIECGRRSTGILVRISVLGTRRHARPPRVRAAR